MALPAPEALVSRALELERLLKEEPTRARELLRRMLGDGLIQLTPQPDGVYLAESTLLPLGFFMSEPQNDSPPTRGGGRSLMGLS